MSGGNVNRLEAFQIPIWKQRTDGVATGKKMLNGLVGMTDAMNET